MKTTLALLLCSLFPTLALAATRHVTPGGSIQAAIAASANGDTIIIRAGSYVENLAIGKSLHVFGPTGPTGAIAEIYGSSSASTIRLGDSITVTIEHLTLHGGSSTI